MNIRKATVEDARILAQLNCHVQQVHADAEPTLYKPAEVTEAMIAHHIESMNDENGTTFIAEDDGKAVGYIHMVVRDRPENPFRHECRDVLVDAMSVNPEYYGTGVADKLMECAVSLARDYSIKRIILDVWDWNYRARRFYAKQGFRTFNHRMQLMLE